MERAFAQSEAVLALFHGILLKVLRAHPSTSVFSPKASPGSARKMTMFWGVTGGGRVCGEGWKGWVAEKALGEGGR